MHEKYTRLPDARAHRRTILVLDRGDIETLEVDPNSRDLLHREDVAILYAGADVASSDPLTQTLERRSQLIPGEVLVASPYRDGDYASLIEAKNRFALEKWLAVSTLCGYLGASSLEVKTIEDIESNKSISISGGGSIKGVGAKFTGESKDLQRFAAEMHLADTYSGGVSDLTRAEEFLRASGLEADAEFRSLIDSRRHEGNLLAHRTLKVDLSQEAQRSMDLTLSINPPLIEGIQNSFKRAREDKTRLRLTLDISFVPSLER